MTCEKDDKERRDLQSRNSVANALGAQRAEHYARKDDMRARAKMRVRAAKKGRR